MPSFLMQAYIANVCIYCYTLSLKIMISNYAYIHVFYSVKERQGQQCCYGNNNKLISTPPGGGTADLVAPNNKVNMAKHFFYDVLPFILCCKGLFKEHTCKKYYEKRPIDDGSRFRPPPPPG